MSLSASGLTSGANLHTSVPQGTLIDQVLAGMAVHAIAHAESAILRDEARLVILGDEVVQVVVGFEDDVAAAPAVAAAGPALGTILLALEGDAAFAAVAGPRVDLDFVNEHWDKPGIGAVE